MRDDIKSSEKFNVNKPTESKIIVSKLIIDSLSIYFI